jgi:hypothetical protein
VQHHAAGPGGVEGRPRKSARWGSRSRNGNAGAAPSKLVDSLKTSVLVADAPLFFDGMFSYVRQR